MASVHRRPDSKFWHAAFRMADGRLVLRSTKCENRQKALAAALEFERAAKLAGAGNLVETQARKILAAIMERAGTDETLRAPTIKAFMTEWLASKQARKSESTHVRYSSDIAKFLETLKDRQNRPLTALTPRDVERFIEVRTGEKLSPTTVAFSGKVLRTALNHARRQGLIPTNPAEAVEFPDAENAERGVFTSAEVKKLFETAEGEWKTLILIGYYTGARLSDCCRMEWAGVDKAASTLTYTPIKTRTKTAMKVIVPLHGELKNHLETLAKQRQPDVFITPHMAGLKSGGRHGLSESFKRIMHNAGLDCGKAQKTGLRQLSLRTFHALRHSFTSALANAGVAPEVRMKLTGHKTEAIHRVYTHHELAPLKAAVDKIPALK